MGRALHREIYGCRVSIQTYNLIQNLFTYIPRNAEALDVDVALSFIQAEASDFVSSYDTLSELVLVLSRVCKLSRRAIAEKILAIYLESFSEAKAQIIADFVSTLTPESPAFQASPTVSLVIDDMSVSQAVTDLESSDLKSTLQRKSGSLTSLHADVSGRKRVRDRSLAGACQKSTGSLLGSCDDNARIEAVRLRRNESENLRVDRRYRAGKRLSEATDPSDDFSEPLSEESLGILSVPETLSSSKPLRSGSSRKTGSVSMLPLSVHSFRQFSQSGGRSKSGEAGSSLAAMLYSLPARSIKRCLQMCRREYTRQFEDTRSATDHPLKVSLNVTLNALESLRYELKTTFKYLQGPIVPFTEEEAGSFYYPGNYAPYCKVCVPCYHPSVALLMASPTKFLPESSIADSLMLWTASGASEQDPEDRENPRGPGPLPAQAAQEPETKVPAKEEPVHGDRGGSPRTVQVPQSLIKGNPYLDFMLDQSRPNDHDDTPDLTLTLRDAWEATATLQQRPVADPGCTMWEYPSYAMYTQRPVPQHHCILDLVGVYTPPDVLFDSVRTDLRMLAENLTAMPSSSRTSGGRSQASLTLLHILRRVSHIVYFPPLRICVDQRHFGNESRFVRFVDRVSDATCYLKVVGIAGYNRLQLHAAKDLGSSVELTLHAGAFSWLSQDSDLMRCLFELSSLLDFSDFLVREQVWMPTAREQLTPEQLKSESAMTHMKEATVLTLMGRRFRAASYCLKVIRVPLLSAASEDSTRFDEWLANQLKDLDIAEYLNTVRNRSDNPPCIAPFRESKVLPQPCEHSKESSGIEPEGCAGAQLPKAPLGGCSKCFSFDNCANRTSLPLHPLNILTWDNLSVGCVVDHPSETMPYCQTDVNLYKFLAFYGALDSAERFASFCEKLQLSEHMRCNLIYTIAHVQILMLDLQMNSSYGSSSGTLVYPLRSHGGVPHSPADAPAVPLVKTEGCAQGSPPQDATAVTQDRAVSASTPPTTAKNSQAAAQVSTQSGTDTTQAPSKAKRKATRNTSKGNTSAATKDSSPSKTENASTSNEVKPAPSQHSEDDKKSIFANFDRLLPDASNAPSPDGLMGASAGMMTSLVRVFLEKRGLMSQVVMKTFPAFFSAWTPYAPFLDHSIFQFDAISTKMFLTLNRSFRDLRLCPDGTITPQLNAKIDAVLYRLAQQNVYFNLIGYGMDISVDKYLLLTRRLLEEPLYSSMEFVSAFPLGRFSVDKFSFGESPSSEDSLFRYLGLIDKLSTDRLEGCMLDAKLCNSALEGALAFHACNTENRYLTNILQEDIDLFADEIVRCLTSDCYDMLLTQPLLSVNSKLEVRRQRPKKEGPTSWPASDGYAAPGYDARRGLPSDHDSLYRPEDYKHAPLPIRQNTQWRHNTRLPLNVCMPRMCGDEVYVLKNAAFTSYLGYK